MNSKKSNKVASISNEEKKWQTNEDAYTLERYAEIVTDPERMARAIEAAKEKANALQQQADGLKKLNEVLEDSYSKKNKKKNGK